MSGSFDFEAPTDEERAQLEAAGWKRILHLGEPWWRCPLNCLYQHTRDALREMERRKTVPPPR